MNANKKILLLDLKNHKQKMDLLQLYKTNDIILDCFRPGVLEKLGLGP
jgi:crotonobetainyl-CoA:carnitine CoA-transferase CaiB-like acyl-CoA transferase